jgi:hypothetical protein
MADTEEAPAVGLIVEPTTPPMVAPTIAQSSAPTLGSWTGPSPLSVLQVDVFKPCV